MASYIFGGDTGETPESVRQKREIANMLLGQTGGAKNWGEGFNSIAKGLVSRWTRDEADGAQKAGQAGANDTFSALTAMLTGQGGATPSRGPQTASDATAALAGGDFMSGLINSESGGNWNALNDEGYGGRLQFGDARLADAARAGVIPSGVTGAAFSQMSPEQQQAVEAWHFADIDQQAQGMGLDRYYGQTIAGVPITPESVKAMAHLGGIGGVQKFVTSGGQYNPADSNGTRLSDYGQRFGGGGQQQAAPAPVQVASLDPSIGMPQAQPAQLPPIGPSGGPQMAAAPQQPGMVPQMPPMQPQAPMVPQQQPMQTAQGPSLQMLMEAAANPWLNEGQRGIVNSMIAQEMQRQDPAYQQNLRAGDLGIQKSELELAAMRNPGKKPPIEVGGVLVDQDTFQPVFDSRQPSDNGFTLSPGQQRFDAQGNPIAAAQPEPGYRQLSPEEVAQSGLDGQKGWQVSPTGEIKQIGGGGVSVSVGGNNDIGTIPPGKMVTRDAQGNVTGMVDIPGGPSDQAAQAAAAASDANAAQTQRYGSVVIEDIDRAVAAIEKDPALTTGIIGQWMSGIGGTPANRVNNLLTTVKANAGFDRLQAMRDASPTGGALGAVSEKELALLNSAIGSLEQSNTSDDLTHNLKRVQQIYNAIVNGMDSAPKTNFDYSSETAPEGWGGDASLWKFLSPEDRALW